MVKLKALLSREGIVGSGLLVFSGGMALSIGGFLFHAIASRKLGVSDYGALYALISVYLVAALPASLFMPVIVKFAAEFHALHDESHVRGLIVLVVRGLGAVGLLYLLVSIVFAAQLGAFLHVASWEIPIVGLTVLVGLLSGAIRAIGQGTQDFVGYAWSTFAEGVGKVAVLGGLGLLGLTLFRSTLAFALGITIGMIAMAIPLVRRYRKFPTVAIHLDWPRIWASSGAAAAAGVASIAMGYADVILVKHYFPASDAGLYSAASLGGKIMLYFVGFVPTVLLPQASAKHARRERTRDALWMAVLLIAAICACGVLLYYFLGGFILHALVGGAFDGAKPLMTGYAAAMGLLALTGALASYGIATHRLGFAVPLVLATLGTLGAIVVAHASLGEVVAEMVMGNIAMAAVVGIALGVQADRAH